VFPAATSGVVTAEGLGAFSTPYQPPAATAALQTSVVRLEREAPAVERYWAPYRHFAYLAAVPTSDLASPYIMLTGEEFLPVGGLSGTVPAPSLSRLRQLVDNGELGVAYIPIRPATHDPRLVYLAHRCRFLRRQPYENGVVLAEVGCSPARAAAQR